MSKNQFLSLDTGTGVKKLEIAINTSTGVSDANKIISTGSDGKIASALLPSGLGSATIVVPASEALAAGNFVNIYDVAGVSTVRKADASNGRYAHGFVLASVTASANATVTLQGVNTGVTGLTAGLMYFLSGTTPGSQTTTPDTTTSGVIVQTLGYATAATSLNFEFDQGISIG